MDNTKPKDDKPNSRKPQGTLANILPPAQEVLNRFLNGKATVEDLEITKNNPLLIGTERPQIDFTNAGQMIISAPKVFAVFSKDVIAQKQNGQGTIN